MLAFMGFCPPLCLFDQQENNPTHIPILPLLNVPHDLPSPHLDSGLLLLDEVLERLRKKIARLLFAKPVQS